MADLPFIDYSFAASGSVTVNEVPYYPVARTMPDRLNDVVNVKDFGATGNGVDDDSAAIQDAIDYAFKFLSSHVYNHGALIYFPAGTYWVGSTTIILDFFSYRKIPPPDWNSGTTYYRGDLVMPGGVYGSLVYVALNTNTNSAPNGFSNPDWKPLYLGGANVKLVGAGRDATIVKGNCSGPWGWIFMKYNGISGSLTNVENMTVWNTDVPERRTITNIVYNGGSPPKATVTTTAVVSPEFIGAINDESGSNINPSIIMRTDPDGWLPVFQVGNGTVVGAKRITDNTFDYDAYLAYTPGSFTSGWWSHVTGAFRLEMTELHPIFRSVRFKGFAGLSLGNNLYCGGYENCIAEGPGPAIGVVTMDRADSVNGTESGPMPGSVGFWGTFQGEMNCRAIGLDRGLVSMTTGAALTAFSASRCNIGVEVGAGTADSAGVDKNDGFSILGCWFDRCKKGIWIYTGTGLDVAGNYISGKTGVADDAPIQGMSWNSDTHVVTVTTADAHNLPTGDSTLVLDTVPASFVPSFDDRVVATRQSSNTFSFPGPATDPTNGGATPFVSGVWNYALLTGISHGQSLYTSYMANALDAVVSRASFDATDNRNGGVGAGTSYVNHIAATSGPYGFSFPTTGNGSTYIDGNAGTWSYDMCDYNANGLVSSPTKPFLTMTNLFYQAPGPPPYPFHSQSEGNEFDIIAIEQPNWLGSVGVLAVTTTVESGTDLTFDSVPSDVVQGMLVFNLDHYLSLHIGSPSSGYQQCVWSVAGNVVTLSGYYNGELMGGPFGITSTVYAGDRIMFSGGAHSYRVKSTGTDFVRIG